MRPGPPGSRSGPFPFGTSATFVTADNPGGATRPPLENEERRVGLAASLDAAGLGWHPAVGGEPDGDHLEPGVVVLGLALDAAADLGARFGQVAIYQWTPDALHLLACDGDRHDILGYSSTAGTTLTPPHLQGLP